MTNTVAFGLVLLIACALALDGLLNHWAGVLYVALKFTELVTALTFWR